jgi:hypothetical protein
MILEARKDSRNNTLPPQTRANAASLESGVWKESYSSVTGAFEMGDPRYNQKVWK